MGVVQTAGLTVVGDEAAEEAPEQAEADRARLQDALAVLQQSLLPASLPSVPGMESAVHYRTASPDRLGGDFYDLFPSDGGRFAFFLGDVCGKGSEAPAVTSLTRYTLRAAALHDPDPVAALTTVNKVLNERYNGGAPRYCTVIYGLLEPDPQAGTVAVHLASGGHPSTLVLRAGARPSSCRRRAGCSSASCPPLPSPPVRVSSVPGTHSCCGRPTARTAHDPCSAAGRLPRPGSGGSDLLRRQWHHRADRRPQPRAGRPGRRRARLRARPHDARPAERRPGSDVSHRSR